MEITKEREQKFIKLFENGRNDSHKITEVYFYGGEPHFCMEGDSEIYITCPKRAGVWSEQEGGEWRPLYRYLEVEIDENGDCWSREVRLPLASEKEVEEVLNLFK